MTVRPTMTEPIAWVRVLIGDPVGPEQTFDNQTIQDYLDRHRTDVRYAPLRPMPSYNASGIIEHRDYYATVGHWEAGEVLYDGTYTPLAVSAADRLTGHWTFTANQPPPVLIVGRFYDIYAAAADLLEAWAAREKLSFDFDADGQAFKQSQKVAALLELAREYRRRQQPYSASMRRTDVDGR